MPDALGSLPARLPGEMLQEQLCRAGGAVKHRPAAPSAGLPGGVNAAAAGFNPRGSSTLTIFRKPAFGFSQKSCPVVGLSRQSVGAASAGLRLLASCMTLVQTFCSAVVLFHFVLHTKILVLPGTTVVCMLPDCSCCCNETNYKCHVVQFPL